MGNGLTAKQERFLQEYIKGSSQRDAYKAAYNCKKMSDKTVDEEACRLMHVPKIAARYTELMERAAGG